MNATITSPLDLVGREYSSTNVTGFDRPEVIIGAPYLLTREWTDAVVAIARTKVNRNKGLVEYNGYNWYATPINPPLVVGDNIYALERGDGKSNPLRRERKRKVISFTDEGLPMTQYGTATPFIASVWVKAELSSPNPETDRHNPKRRDLVLERLSSEGMRRIGDTGYAISAKEFFENFDLPRPDVQPTALVDVTETIQWRDMNYELRDMFTRKGLTSLRNATFTGRAKVKLPKSKCRCAEITIEDVMRLPEARNWNNPKVHKVHCLWCMVPDSKTGVIDPEDI